MFSIECYRISPLVIRFRYRKRRVPETRVRFSEFSTNRTRRSRPGALDTVGNRSFFYEFRLHGVRVETYSEIEILGPGPRRGRRARSAWVTRDKPGGVCFFSLYFLRIARVRSSITHDVM